MDVIVVLYEIEMFDLDPPGARWWQKEFEAYPMSEREQALLRAATLRRRTAGIRNVRVIEGTEVAHG